MAKSSGVQRCEFFTLEGQMSQGAMMMVWLHILQQGVPTLPQAPSPSLGFCASRLLWKVWEPFP